MKLWGKTQICWTFHFRLTRLQHVCHHTSKKCKKCSLGTVSAKPSSHKWVLITPGRTRGCCTQASASLHSAGIPARRAPPRKRLPCRRVALPVSRTGAPTAAAWATASHLAGIDHLQPPRHSGQRVRICAPPFSGQIVTARSSSQWTLLLNRAIM